MTKTGVAEAQKLAREWRAEPLPRGTLGDYEFCGPDYAQLGLWARALKLSLTAVLERLTSAVSKEWPDGIRFEVVDGAIRNLVLDLKVLPLTTFEWVPGLQIRWLVIQNGGDSSPKIFSGRLPALTRLRCSNNQLTALDLSGVPALTSLRCDSNQLTELDLSGVPALTELHCDSNQLTELDLSGVPALTWLSCESNQLTELDLSGVPALTTLTCDRNQLTELNLRKQKKLEHFSCDDSVKVRGQARYKQN